MGSMPGAPGLITLPQYVLRSVFGTWELRERYGVSMAPRGVYPSLEEAMVEVVALRLEGATVNIFGANDADLKSTP